jgi:hypothetical protein
MKFGEVEFNLGVDVGRVVDQPFPEKPSAGGERSLYAD